MDFFRLFDCADQLDLDLDSSFRFLSGAARTARRRTKPRRDKRSPTTTAVQTDAFVPVWVMKITQDAYREALEHLTSAEPELAGLFLGPTADDALVTHFIPDDSGESSPAAFRLGIENLNRHLKTARASRLNCKGIIHSHPSGLTHPSAGDLEYLQGLFALPANAGAAQFFVPIVADGRFHPYVYAGGSIWPTTIQLV
jgi:proteasome lid subunit RPN8/RPN11